MKTQKIQVNKTTEKPDGTEVDIVLPEGSLEERFMGFVLQYMLQAAQRENKLAYKLPPRLKIDYRKEGSFLVSGSDDKSGLYLPMKPVALCGVRQVGSGFDIIHGQLPQAGDKKADAPAAAATPQ